ncbi:hypothetical protein JW766_06175 [Candidatus Dojkabacteria bacterium]|nr:hypothetical protein [Candidatus Dojkabacteria bacterium]
MKKILLTTTPFIIVSLFLLSLATDVWGQSASLYFSPSSQSVSLNQEFSVQVMINTSGVNVNGVTADFTFPTDRLQVVSIDDADSEFTQELESTFSGGTVYISRGTPGGESFNGTGNVATVNFRATGSGTATLEFTSDATVTDTGANNVLGSTSSATIASGSLPAAGVFDRPVTIIIGAFALILICIGVIAILQYKKEKNHQLELTSTG